VKVELLQMLELGTHKLEVAVETSSIPLSVRSKMVHARLADESFSDQLLSASSHAQPRLNIVDIELQCLVFVQNINGFGKDLVTGPEYLRVSSGSNVVDSAIAWTILIWKAEIPGID
jgi:hypothetical protein